MRIVKGNALFMHEVADKSVHCVVTSPPYWGLRTYGDSAEEVGRFSLIDYVQDIELLGDEVARVLKDDGLFWLNVGDTAAGSGGSGGDYRPGGKRDGKNVYKQGKSNVPGGQWTLVPQRVSLALQERGWLVRSWITWSKGRPRPESLAHVKRPRVTTEVILMLAKGRPYRFFPERLVGDAKTDVWKITPPRTDGSHPATFPAELPRRCILASTEPGDTVLDPFCGVGTTLKVAEEEGRVGIGYDLYEFGS